MPAATDGHSRRAVPGAPVSAPRAARGPSAGDAARPLLMVDVDGVISLFGFDLDKRPEGRFHSIDGIPHYLSAQAGRHLLELWPVYELVWASGWEEKANEHLPRLLGLPGPLPHLSFERGAGAGSSMPGAGPGASMRAHWKLDAIERYAAGRPLAWVDDAFNDACHRWASAREAPTLLVQTLPHAGLTRNEAELLARWASSYSSF
jgi:hypothetical protein